MIGSNGTWHGMCQDAPADTFAMPSIRPFFSVWSLFPTLVTSLQAKERRPFEAQGQQDGRTPKKAREHSGKDQNTESIWPRRYRVAAHSRFAGGTEWTES